VNKTPSPEEGGTCDSAKEQSGKASRRRKSGKKVPEEKTSLEKGKKNDRRFEEGTCIRHTQKKNSYQAIFSKVDLEKKDGEESAFGNLPDGLMSRLPLKEGEKGPEKKADFPRGQRSVMTRVNRL